MGCQIASALQLLCRFSASIVSLRVGVSSSSASTSNHGILQNAELCAARFLLRGLRTAQMSSQD